jgi:hypothetical protein
MAALSCWPTVLSVLRAATTSSTGRLGPLTTSSSDSSTNVQHHHHNNIAAVELQLQLVHLIAVQLVFAWRRSSSSWSTLASEYDDDKDDDDNNLDQADIAGGRPIHVIASRGTSPEAMTGEWPPGNAKEGLDDDDHDHDGTDTGDDDEDWHDNDDVIGFADAIVVAVMKDVLDCEREERTFFSNL